MGSKGRKWNEGCEWAPAKIRLRKLIETPSWQATYSKKWVSVGLKVSGERAGSYRRKMQY